MAQPDLTARPLGLSEVVDRSVAVVLRHFRPLFVAMLVIQAPALLFARRLSGATELLGAASEPERAAELLARAARSASILAVSLMALQLLATAAVAVIVRPSLDPLRGVMRPSRTRALLAVASATALHIAVLVAAPVAGSLPGVALAFRAIQTGSYPTLLVGAAGALAGGLGLFLVVTLRLMLTPAVAALEGRAGLAALARSTRLMSPRPGSRLVDRPAVRASLVLLAILVLAVAVNGLAGLPRLLALRIQGAPAGLALLGASLPLPLEVALSLFEAVAGAALQPFSLVAVVLFYFDRRARTEGLDLELWAERLEEGA